MIRSNKDETCCNTSIVLIIPNTTSSKLGKTGIMGVKPYKNHPHVPQAVPVTANSTTYNNIVISPLQSEITLERGPLLGIMRPVWIKTVESEERMRWLVQMIDKSLLRDIEAFL